MKYVDLRRLAQKGFRDLTADEVAFEVDSNLSQMNVDLEATKGHLIAQERELVLMKSREKLDSNAIINKTIFIEDLKKAIVVLEKAIEELF